MWRRHSLTRCSCQTQRYQWFLIVLLPWIIGGCATVRNPLGWSSEQWLAKLQETTEPPKELGKRNPFALFDRPSHDRRWKPSLAILPYAEFHGNHVTIRNVRDCRYRSEDDYDVRHYDLSFDLDEVRSADFILVPFQNAPILAHTMLSFGLANGEHFIVSVEARLEQDEEYSAAGGSSKQFELMYVIGSERDLILLRTEVRQAEVYIYRTNAQPHQVQDLLVDVLGRVNQIAREPEYYDLLTNNCTTNLVSHVNRLKANRIPLDMRIVLPGMSDRLAYQLGIIEANGSFAEIKSRSRVNERVAMYRDAPDFSQKIRQR